MILPPDFIRQTQALLREEYNAFEKALEMPAPVSIRLNPYKSYEQTTSHTQVPWCEAGRYLPERPAFTFDPLFHAGTYYVQEASSMFLEQAFRTIEKDFSQNTCIALDLCAAPGGKSTHLLSLLPKNGLLVSNEVVRSRCMVLAENIAKWGLPNQITTQNDPLSFAQHTHLFDIILADLPCSGEGMFRKDPTSRAEWSIDHVKHCASRQRRIIRDVWEALKPGGWLIYSTCTFNTEENEANVSLLANELGADLIPIATQPEWQVANAFYNDLPVCRFFPHRTQGEGFFIALMRKHNAAATRVKPTAVKRPDNRQPTPIPAAIKNTLRQPEQFIFNSTPTGAVYAIPALHEYSYILLSSRLHVVSAGIPLGRVKGKDFIPAPALALNTELNRQHYPTIELPYEQAVRYLQKETIEVPANTPKGHLFVTFRQQPLGFVKNIGHRTNNLYPSEWRIRSQKPG